MVLAYGAEPGRPALSRPSGRRTVGALLTDSFSPERRAVLRRSTGHCRVTQTGHGDVPPSDAPPATVGSHRQVTETCRPQTLHTGHCRVTQTGHRDVSSSDAPPATVGSQTGHGDVPPSDAPHRPLSGHTDRSQRCVVLRRSTGHCRVTQTGHGDVPPSDPPPATVGSHRQVTETCRPQTLHRPLSGHRQVTETCRPQTLHRPLTGHTDRSQRRAVLRRSTGHCRVTQTGHGDVPSSDAPPATVGSHRQVTEMCRPQTLHRPLSGHTDRSRRRAALRPSTGHCRVTQTGHGDVPPSDAPPATVGSQTGHGDVPPSDAPPATVGSQTGHGDVPPSDPPPATVGSQTGHGDVPSSDPPPARHRLRRSSKLSQLSPLETMDHGKIGRA